MQQLNTVSVLFCCLGNICRSPTAQGVFEERLRRRGWVDRVVVDSCGTTDWHVGKAPDSRAVRAAAERGYDISALRARQVSEGDFAGFDYIVAMDQANLAELETCRPAGFRGELKLFLDYAPQLQRTEVPDPYFGEEDGFSLVLDLIEEASEGLLDAIASSGRLAAHAFS